MRWFRNRTTGVVEAWPDTDPGKLAEMVTREGPVHSLPHEEVTSEIGGGGGGGSIPVPSTQDFIGGSITTVANGANANMPWDTGSVIGDDLVDLSDPARPAVRTAGIYAVTVNLAAVTDMTVNGFFDFEIQLDANGADLSGPQDSRLATAAHPQPQSVQTVVGYIPAGGLIIVTMHNRDGAAAVDFALESAFIQRIT